MNTTEPILSGRQRQTSAELMTLIEVADYLRCHSTTIYRLVRKGEFPAFRVGSDYRFLKKKSMRGLKSSMPKYWSVCWAISTALGFLLTLAAIDLCFWEEIKIAIWMSRHA